jgi:flagellar protein FliS
MFNKAAIARYRNVQITTSSPGEVLLLLYSGLLRFLNEAIHAMKSGDRARAGERIGRAHAILDELHTTLKPSAAPELAANLQGVYLFAMEQILAANCEQSVDKLENAVRVLRPIEEAFRAVLQVDQPRNEAAAR